MTSLLLNLISLFDLSIYSTDLTVGKNVAIDTAFPPEFAWQ